jgi:hypothetical protein
MNKPNRSRIPSNTNQGCSPEKENHLIFFSKTKNKKQKRVFSIWDKYATIVKIA